MTGSTAKLKGPTFQPNFSPDIDVNIKYLGLVFGKSNPCADHGNYERVENRNLLLNVGNKFVKSLSRIVAGALSQDDKSKNCKVK